MRMHRAFPGMQPWTETALLRELVHVESLTTVRVEPITRAREPAAIVDLHFADGVRHVTIPLVLVDVAMLQVREADPLVFPHVVAQAVGDALLRPIVEVVAAALESRAYRGGRWTEEVIALRPDPLFVAARERGWFAAAPLETSLPRVAPASYARRFAAGRTAVTFGPDAVELAAFLREGTRRCEVAASDPEAARYFAAPSLAEARHYDVALGSGDLAFTADVIVRCDGDGPELVPVVAPLPANVMISFDPIDGPVVGTFAVDRASAPPLREIGRGTPLPSVGGSAGRIALVLRPDAAVLPDADVDEARTLAQGLVSEGFSVTLATRVADVAAFAPDLVHLFGVRDGAHAAAVAAWTSENGVPLAVHAYHEDPAAGAYWGAMVTRYCFAYSADDRSVSNYLGLLAKRAVEVDGVGAHQRFAPPAAGLDQAEAVLREAALVFVESERERHVVAALRAGRRTVVVPPLPLAYDDPEPIGALVGRDPFVLVHAPVGSAGNQLLVGRAAASLGVPIVLTGPVAEPAYGELVREFAGAGVRLIPEPRPGQLAALYRSAAIVADVAWLGRGHGRIAEAARSGSATVVASSRWVDLPIPERWSADPADVDSVARAIGEAWDAVARRDPALVALASAAAAAGARALREIVGGYAAIASAA